MKDKAGITVEVVNGDVERALRKLKKRMQNAGVFQELRKHEAYEKPSTVKRRERMQARAREQKKNSIGDTTRDQKLDY